MSDVRRVRTAFRELTLRASRFGTDSGLRQGSQGNATPTPSAQSDGALLNELLFELRGRNLEVIRVLREVQRVVRGSLAPLGSASALSVAGLAELERDLTNAVRSGKLQLSDVRPPEPATRQRNATAAPLGPQATVDEVTTFIGVRVLDDQGQPVAAERVQIELPDGSVRQTRTDATGAVLISGLSPGGNAKITLLDQNEPGDADPIEEDESFYLLKLVDEIGSPIDGVELVFTIDGIDQSVITAGGQARIDRVPPGKATVRLGDSTALRQVLRPLWNQVRTGPSLTSDDGVTVMPVREPLEAISVDSEVPSTISLQPHVRRARLFGNFFDTAKSFLLPSALANISQLKELFSEDRNHVLLIVGHTDTAGGSALNDVLSVERAQAMKDFLTDHVDGWLKFYSADGQKRWGKHEDLLMMSAFPDNADLLSAADPIRRYQETRGLAVDGVAGDETHRALVREYMAMDDAPVPNDIPIVIHGCGENFPEDPEPDDTADQLNRDVELFFFDAKLGVQPPPPGKNSPPASTAYPEWQRRSVQTDDFTLLTRTLRLFLLDERYQRMPNTDYQLTMGNLVRRNKSDDDGLLVEADLPAPGPCQIQWCLTTLRDAPDPSLDPVDRFAESDPIFLFTTELNLDLQDGVAPPQMQEEATLRLSNLGYSSGNFAADFALFRQDYDLSPNDAALSQTTFDQLVNVHANGIEAPLPDPLPPGTGGDDQEFEEDGGSVLPVEVTVTSDDGASLAGKRYEIRDGGVVLRSGVLDDTGKVSITDLDIGDYAFALPDLDADAWDLDSETADG